MTFKNLKLLIGTGLLSSTVFMNMSHAETPKKDNQNSAPLYYQEIEKTLTINEDVGLIFLRENKKYPAHNLIEKEDVPLDYAKDLIEKIQNSEISNSQIQYTESYSKNIEKETNDPDMKQNHKDYIEDFQKNHPNKAKIIFRTTPWIFGGNPTIEIKIYEFKTNANS